MKPGDKVQAYALFAKPPVEAEVIEVSEGRVTIEFGGGRVTEVGLAQVVGTPEYQARMSGSGRYQADGLGCVERVSGVERDWDDPAAHRPRGY